VTSHDCGMHVMQAMNIHYLLTAASHLFWSEGVESQSITGGCQLCDVGPIITRVDQSEVVDEVDGCLIMNAIL